MDAATRLQAERDSGRSIVVGVNSFQNHQAGEQPPALRIDNEQVVERQRTRLAALRVKRNAAEVNDVLARLKHAAQDGKSNVLDFAIEAVRARATVGEISKGALSTWRT